MTKQQDLRKIIIGWLDDNYHFGGAEALIGADDRSLLKTGILDSLGFVSLVLFLENECNVEIDRSSLNAENFDSLAKIVRYISVA